MKNERVKKNIRRLFYNLDKFFEEKKNEQNRNQASEEGRVVQIKNKPNAQNSFYKDIFSLKKRLDINKIEKLDKLIVENKLNQIKELQK